MKKIFLVMLFVLTAQCLMAQDYKPMSEFGTDTLGYLKYNFRTRKNQYIGNTLEKVINDYELEMKDVKYTFQYVEAKNKFYLTGIGISHFTVQEYLSRWDNKSPMIRFVVDFDPPYDDYVEIAQHAPLFDTERERASYIKDKIVKTVRVYIFDRNASSTPPSPTDPYPYKIKYLEIPTIPETDPAIDMGGEDDDNEQ